jgi:hypothetical protein
MRADHEPIPSSVNFGGQQALAAEKLVVREILLKLSVYREPNSCVRIFNEPLYLA